jgi:hypothetical protein
MPRILVVEGSDHKNPRDPASALQTLWDVLCDALVLPRFDRVVAISKRCIADLSDEKAAAALDEELVRLRLGGPDDALLLAWDCKPEWAAVTAQLCRYRETVALYEQLDQRQRLPADLRAHVAARRQDFAGRATAQDKTSPPVRLVAGALQALCMDPEFEDLFKDESMIRDALGLRGETVADWPKGWGKRFPREPKGLLDAAIDAAKRHRPRPEVVRRIGLDYTRNQGAWAAHFIRTFAESRPDAFRRHRICDRLCSLLG